MAHYVAEQIAIAEKAPENKKIEANQRCFDTILKLWEHRSSLPRGRYPFKSFEPIFKALNRLNPDNSQSYYFDNSPLQSTASNDDTSEVQMDEVQSWTNIALEIDRDARVLIDYALKQAACWALDEKTAAWLENAAGISGYEESDIPIIVRLVEGTQEDDHSEKALEEIRQDLQSKINKIDALAELSSFLRATLVENLDDISQEHFSADTPVEP